MKKSYVFITIRHARRKANAALAVLCVIVLAVIGNTAWQRLAITADAGSAASGVRLPIIMYHSVVNDGKPKNDYQITVSQLASDLDYLAERGYTAVLIADLIRYANSQSPLPSNPVVLTFDDGQLNNLVYALPQLSQRSMRGVFSVCGAFIERAERERDPSPLYAYMTWADVREAASSGVVEIQNHSYNLHGDKGRKGFTRRAGETKTAFQSSLIEDVSKMQQLLRLNGGIEATCFTYPYGFTYDGSWTMLRDLGFQAAMTCREKVNYLPCDPSALFHLDRFNRSGLTTTERFMKQLGIE